MSDPTPAPAAKPPKKRKAVLLLLLVFALGLVFGAGGTTLVILKRLQNNLRNPVVADGVGARFLNRMNRNLTKDLKLNPEEQEAVKEELGVTQERLRQIRTGLLRDVRGLAGDSVERISKRLPEEKRELLRQRVRERLRPWGVEPLDPDKP